jgi:hypothetical protein
MDAGGKGKVAERGAGAMGRVEGWINWGRGSASVLKILLCCGSAELVAGWSRSCWQLGLTTVSKEASVM